VISITNHNFNPIIYPKVIPRPCLALSNQPTQDQITFGNDQAKLHQKLKAALMKSSKAYDDSTTITEIKAISLVEKKFSGLITRPVEVLLAKTQVHCGETYEGLAVFSKKGVLLGDIKHLDAEEWKGYEAEKAHDSSHNRFKEGKYLRLHNLNASYSDDYKGVGTALIKEAIEESKKHGFDGQLKVHAENVIDLRRGCPIPFYAKMGFIPYNSPLTKEELIKEYSKPKNAEATMKMFLLTPERAVKLRAQNASISFGSASEEQIEKCKQSFISRNEEYEDYDASTSLENFKDITLFEKQPFSSTSKPVNAFLAKTKNTNCEGLAVFSKEGKLLGTIQCLDAEEWKTTDEDIGKYLRLHSLNASYSRNYKGVGTALIKAAIEESKAQGLGGQLKVHAYNTVDSTKGCPIPFYAKMGFVPDSHYPPMSKDELIEEYSKSYHSNSAMKMFLINPDFQKPQQELSPRKTTPKSFLSRLMILFK